MAIIRIGLVCNNITTGPNHYAFYRQCLTGPDLSKFDEIVQNAGVETIARLTAFLWGFRESFVVKDPFLAQTCYIHNYKRKRSHTLTRKYVGAVRNINNYLTEFPPNYEFGPKLIYAALLDPLLARFPKRSRTLLI